MLRAISPFPTVFSKGLFLRPSKGVIVWEWVNNPVDKAFKKATRAVNECDLLTPPVLWQKQAIKTRCVCETLMPRNTHILRNMTLIFDLDLCRWPWPWYQEMCIDEVCLLLQTDRWTTVKQYAPDLSIRGHKQEGHDVPVSLHWLICEIHSYQTLHYLGIGLKHRTPYKD